MPGHFSAQACGEVLLLSDCLCVMRKKNNTDVVHLKEAIHLFGLWNKGEQAWHPAGSLHYVKKKLVRRETWKFPAWIVPIPLTNAKSANAEFPVSGSKITSVDDTPFWMHSNEIQAIALSDAK